MTGSIVASETIIAPSTDSSASRFCGGTMLVLSVVANFLPRAGHRRPAGRDLPPIDKGPAEFDLPRGGSSVGRISNQSHPGGGCSRVSPDFRAFFFGGLLRLG